MSALLLRWGSYHWACNLWGLIIYLFFLPVMLPSEIPKLPTPACERVSWCLETSLFLRLLAGTELRPYLFCLSICLLYFFLAPFEDNGFFFWVPDVLCRHSEGVSWFYSAFKCSFDELVGEKVVSPSYSSAMLGLPLTHFLY